MAGSVNKVILVGNLGADPEARSLGSGGEVVNLRLATTESWTDRDGKECERLQIIADTVISAKSVRPGGGRRQAREDDRYGN